MERPRRHLRPRRVRRPLRLLAAASLLLIGFVYYKPVRTYFETRRALEARAGEVSVLQRERAALRRRLTSRTSETALVREARRLGYVKAGERLFIVKGIDEWRRVQGGAAGAPRSSRRPK